MHTKTILPSDPEIITLLDVDCLSGTMALYDRYAHPLLLAIYHIVREKEATDEILTKTLAIVCKTYSSNLQQKEKLLPWVMAIAREQANLFKVVRIASVINGTAVAKKLTDFR